jgi:hypothetical protein
MAKGLYFTSTSHVFGSNTSEPLWEPFRCTIQKLVTIYFERDDSVAKHKTYLDMIQWQADHNETTLVKAHKCPLNCGVLNKQHFLIPPLVQIYVDDIIGAGVSITKILAAIVEAIFVVCGQPDTSV